MDTLLKIFIPSALIIGILIDRIGNVIEFRDDIKYQIIRTQKFSFKPESLEYLLPSFNKMLFSFKPLKIENWFTPNEITKLFTKK